MKLKSLLIALMCLAFFGCRTRKVLSDKESYSDKSVIKQERSSETVLRDTTRITTIVKEQAADTSSTVIKIYPTNGTPFTLTTGETFTGMADSVIMHKKVKRNIQREQLTDEKKGIETKVNARENIVVRSDVKSTKKIKEIDSSPLPTLVMVLAGLLTAAAIILYILYRRSL